jgi:hypothetical protein
VVVFMDMIVSPLLIRVLANPATLCAEMPWIVTSPPAKTWANTQVGMREILAIRLDAETGATEFLLAAHNEQPEWVPISDIEGANTAPQS